MSWIWLDLVVKATAVLGAAALVLRAAPGASASTRHLARTSALALLLVLPLLSFLPPALRISPIPKLQEPAAPMEIPEPPASTPEPAIPSSAGQPPERTVPPPAVQGATRRLSPYVPAGLACLWLLGAICGGIRLAAARFRLARLLARSLPVTGEAWTGLAERARRSLGLRRTPLLVRSAETEVPLAAGLLSPRVVLPADADEWPEARRRAVLCHEFAHVKRMDPLTRFLEQLAGVLYWFHPLVRITARAADLDRERACDDLVLESGARASDYAAELVAMLSCFPPERHNEAGLAMGRRSQIEARLAALLQTGHKRAAV